MKDKIINVLKVFLLVFPAILGWLFMGMLIWYLLDLPLGRCASTVLAIGAFCIECAIILWISKADIVTDDVTIPVECGACKAYNPETSECAIKFDHEGEHLLMQPNNYCSEGKLFTGISKETLDAINAIGRNTHKEE